MTATVSPLTTAMPEAPEEALSLADYVPYRLVTAAAAVTRLIARAYEDRFGLTIPQWRLMSVLAEGGLTPHAAVARTAMDKVRVSRAAQDLVERRLVNRTTVRADRRSHRLELTAAGRPLRVSTTRSWRPSTPSTISDSRFLISARGSVTSDMTTIVVTPHACGGAPTSLEVTTGRRVVRARAGPRRSSVRGATGCRGLCSPD